MDFKSVWTGVSFYSSGARRRSLPLHISSVVTGPSLWSRVTRITQSMVVESTTTSPTVFTSSGLSLN
jgi:hypothetical protein